MTREVIDEMTVRTFEFVIALRDIMLPNYTCNNNPAVGPLSIYSFGPSRSQDRAFGTFWDDSVALFEFSVCPNPRRERAARPEMRNRPCPLSAFPQRFAKIKNLQAVGLDSASPPPYRSSSAG